MTATHGTSTESPQNDAVDKVQPPLQEVLDFSLVLGGPVFQLLRKYHLEGEEMQLLHRRILVSVLLAWFPLLLLSTFVSTFGSVGRLSFFHDIPVHVRFLVALPVLIASELLVHFRIRPVVRRFLECRIVVAEDTRRFDKAIESALKIRNSVFVELSLLALVYLIGLSAWISGAGVGPATWSHVPGEKWRLTVAGYWYLLVSLPVFRFVLLRWYLRLFIWFRFLWQVNRIELNLVPTHPDRCGGLSFLGRSSYAYAPILFAQGAILAGIVADRVLNGGEKLQSFKFQIGGFVLFFLVIVLGPLLMFTPRLARAKRKGLADYGILAQRYVEAFDRKWVQGAFTQEELLGTGDIQSLADLENSYDVVRDMRVAPFGLQDVSRLAIATAAPLCPLLLTVFSLDELIVRVIKVVF
jgi:hypothetical protein